MTWEKLVAYPPWLKTYKHDGKTKDIGEISGLSPLICIVKFNKFTGF